MCDSLIKDSVSVLVRYEKQVVVLYWLCKTLVFGAALLIMMVNS